jgi:hypothetical protein
MSSSSVAFLRASRWTWAALLLTVVGLPACATSSGGSAVFRRELGSGTESNAREIMERVTGLRQYQIEQIEPSPNFSITTQWRDRPPFPDERLLGILEAETRLILVGRIRVPATEAAGEQFAFTLIVENRTRGGDGEPWISTRNTELFRNYAQVIADQLEQEFRTIGIRRF